MQLGERIRKNRGARVAIASGRRFITKDPIRFDGGFNLYAYAANDPVNFFDPDGTFILAAAPVLIELAPYIAAGAAAAIGLAVLTPTIPCDTVRPFPIVDGVPIDFLPPANDNAKPKSRDEICAEKAAALKAALEAMGKPPDEIARIVGAFWSACMQGKDTYPYKGPK